jgi:2-oxoacid:acceptor oxidoreductase gamma subunit (pyruvate/2-ketoisovalerate family)
MLEIRIHGRGGQGAVIASEILACAFFYENKVPKAFAQYGSERRGAPVQSYVRVSDRELHLRSKIYYPDHIIVLDESLFNIENPTMGLKNNGSILINTKKSPKEFNFKDFKIANIDANNIALKYGLGTHGTPIVNTIILGAFAKITNLVKIESIEKGIKDHILIKTDANIKAMKEAYENVAY